VQISAVKRKLAEGKPVLVPKVCYHDPNIVEMLGLLGFDCVWLCTEYRAIGPATLEHLIRAARAAGMECLVRGGVNGYDELVRFLAAGTNGIMLPHVCSADHARRAVERIKYPPLGKRELENVNADARFGTMSLEEYLRAANDETLVVAQVEDMAAIEQADEIARVDGIDVLFVGTGDLALTLGVPGQHKHARVIEAIRRVVEACRSGGRICGAPALDPDHCHLLMEEGVQYFTDGSDWRLLLEGFRRVKEHFGQIGFTFHPEGLRA
jgi:4-hydroxy-2-oxoheptanedioate aldolase